MATLFSIAPVWYLLLLLGAFLALGFVGARLWAWTLVAFLGLLALGASWPWWVVLAVPAVVFNVTPVRRVVATAPVLGFMRKMGFLPRISDTERTAIEAGTVWVDGELFSGRPDFRRLLSEPYPDLTERERAFLDGPVEEVCRMTRDWEVHLRRDIPPEAWEFLKKERFFGLIIPEEFGGLGFSASANSAIVAKVSSRSMTLAVTVMVPNSLGPAELLLHYGTDAQKRHWLPRLADGREVPAFALTEPGAGSDAGAIQASGTVFRGEDGELYLRLDWNKRYITLAAISTVLGLAFKLRDPENLLGKGEDLGITCALVPSDTEGVELGRRHDPLGVPFYNCPTTGVDVVVPIDAIIGGAEGVGRGWQMLMETLAAGRGISLPASSTAGVKTAARVAGAYSAVRKQFGLPIGRFEGIHEPLARIGGWSYLLEAARRYTCGAIDAGSKPAVITAMMKYNSTELYRAAMNDAMDIVGGAGISLGPRNMLGLAYHGIPVCITVEGANILTRTLMVFGQGAIRCHPHAYAEIDAAARNDVVAFDGAFWPHIGHVVRNGSRAFLLSLTRGHLAGAHVGGPGGAYAKKLSWASASFAFLTDVAMGTLGGDLKRREMLTGRFSDVFSWMYLSTATLRRFEAEGRRAEDLPAFHWAMQHALARIQQGFDGIFENMNVVVLGPLMRGPIALWSRLNPIGTGPSDALGSRVAESLQVPGAAREALTPGLYRPAGDDPHAFLEETLERIAAAVGVVAKIRAAQKERRLPKGRPTGLLDDAVTTGVIGVDEADLVRRAEAAREDAIQVDSFTLEEFLASAVAPDDRSGAGPPRPVAHAG
jgi:acyl-CoA dehydrogenase